MPLPTFQTDPDDEAALVERAQHGDRDALDELFRRHLPSVQAWVRLKCSDLIQGRESIGDVVQSTFRTALEDLDKFEHRGANSFRNWILTYAVNKIRNREQYYRAAKRSPDRESDEPLSQFYASVCTASQIASSQESIRRFEEAFRGLNSRDQDVILLARIEGLTHAQIGERLGLSEVASRQALNRAIVRLASRLADLEEGERNQPEGA